MRVPNIIVQYAGKAGNDTMQHAVNTDVGLNRQSLGDRLIDCYA